MLSNLDIACDHGYFEVVKFLLKNSKEKRINIFKKTNNQMTAEDLAQLNAHNNVLELLEDWNHAWTLQIAIEATKAKLKFILRIF